MNGFSNNKTVHIAHMFGASHGNTPRARKAMEGSLGKHLKMLATPPVEIDPKRKQGNSIDEKSTWIPT